MEGESFQVEGYTLSNLLGAGTTGELWLASAADGGEQVALRRIRLREPDQAERLRQRVMLIGMIDHPHLQRIVESKPMGDELVLVLEHAGGGTLDQLLSGRVTLDPGEVVTTAGPIAEALADAHERGLTHGDITPEVILYMPDGRPLLGDIGLYAVLAGPETMIAHGYRDPAGGPPSPAGDVYALAAVCYTALTGAPPEPGQQRRPLSEAVPGLPEGVVHAVEAGLQADPARRLAAGQFASMLYGACPPSPVRFPVGLALSDADIAAALAKADAAPQAPQGTPTGSPPEAGQGTTGQPPLLGAPPGTPVGAPSAQQVPPPQAPAQPAAPQDPFAYAMSGRTPQPNMFGAVPSTVEYDEDDDEGGGPRIGLIIAVVAGLVLGAAVAVGGWFWWQDRNTDNGGGPTAEQEGGTNEVDDDPEGGNGGGEPEPGGGPEGDDDPDPEPPDTPEARWTAELERLDGIRSTAYSQVDPELLRQVFAPGAEQLMARDRDVIEAGAANGLRIDGLENEIHELEIEDEGEDEVVLLVTEQLRPYVEVDESGRSNPQPGGAPTSRKIILVRDGETWLIAASEQA